MSGKMDLERLQALEIALVAIAKKNKASVPDLTDACRVPVVTHVNALIRELEQSTGYDRFGAATKRAPKQGDVVKAEKQKQAAEVAEANSKWTEQELVDLAKAIHKYPGGSFDRYACAGGGAHMRVDATV